MKETSLSFRRFFLLIFTILCSLLFIVSCSYPNDVSQGTASSKAPAEPVTDEETFEPETTEAESTQPEVTTPLKTEPETSTPATTVSETTSPETTEAVTTKKKTETSVYTEEQIKNAYLTYGGINEISSGKNIVIFILDRFDISYYNSLVKSNPEVFTALTGFTFFEDNISSYSRTFPGMCSLITGIDNDFSANRETYFYNAYQTSPFLQDLLNNNYRIKIYTDQYYVYSQGTALYGIADNLSTNYKFARYELDDAALYKRLKNGLKLDSSENSYTIIHMNGCHSPYTMDSQCNAVESTTSTEAILGCFKIIQKYLSEMKRLGVYEDATIVITGDHPRARDDTKNPEEPRITSLFVKPSGTNDEALAYSRAQVSQKNLIPFLVSSAEIETTQNYGRSYFDIKESETITRYHNFELTTGGSNYIVTYLVSGKGNNFSNWKIVSTKNIGSLYK